MRADESRLDVLARGLAAGMSRREALRAGGAALIGAAMITPADAVAKLTGHCPHGRVHCHGKCCPKGEVCLPPKHKGGTRRCGCPKHHTRCAGKCVDTKSNVHNCGACGHSCGAGQTCTGGVCTGCPAGMVSCSGVCVTLASDHQNCGACGHACASVEVCASGKCASQCPAGMSDCSGSCVNVMTDVANCGSCGHHCPTNATCVNGTCVCPSGTSVCNGACVDPMTSASGCGTNCVNCTALPFVQNVTCSSGTCMYTCAPNWQNCSGNAADGCPCLGATKALACNPDGTCKQT
jgi:hypothetical protein